MNFAGFKIGLVGPLPPPEGGMAIQTAQLARLLGDAGATVVIVRVNEPYRPLWVRKLRGVRALLRLIAYLVRLWKAIGQVDVVHLLANSGWSWHLFAAPAIWVAWLRKRPVIVNYRGGEAENFFSRSWWVVKPTLKRASRIMVPSGFLVEVFKKRGFSASIVPNVLDLTNFPCRGATVENISAPRFIITRNLEAIYDIDTAIRAFYKIKQEIRGAQLSIAGSGPEEKILKAQVHELGLDASVQFCGRLNRQEIIGLYQNADLMLNASVEDNSPNSLIEAMACGVPVVSTSVGGIPWLIEDRVSGLLVPARQPDDMAKAAIELLRNALLRSHIIGEALNVAQRFDQKAVLVKLEVEYADLVNH